MAAKCVEDLKAAVEAVKADYADDPKWASVIKNAEEAVSEAERVESPSEPSAGQKSADSVHKEVKPETPADEKKEDPTEENSESKDAEDQEHPKDMRSAAKMALLMLRKK